MKYFITSLLAIFISLTLSSQVYIFKAYAVSESVEKFIDSTILKKENKMIVKTTTWGEWKSSKIIVMFDLDKSTLSLLGDSAIVYNVERDSIGSDERIMAMLGRYKEQTCYIRIIKKEEKMYHLYIDTKEKSIAYEMGFRERIETKTDFPE